MTLPDKPLEVTLDVNELTVDEMVLFDPGGFTMLGFKHFLSNHTNWTEEEVGKITLKELMDISDELGKKIQEVAVPFES